MSSIEITGWSPGVDTQRCLDVLRSFASLSAADAKLALESVLRNERVQLPMRSEGDAKLLLSALQKLGMAGRVLAE